MTRTPAIAPPMRLSTRPRRTATRAESDRAGGDVLLDRVRARVEEARGVGEGAGRSSRADGRRLLGGILRRRVGRAAVRAVTAGDGPVARGGRGVGVAGAVGRADREGVVAVGEVGEVLRRVAGREGAAVGLALEGGAGPVKANVKEAARVVVMPSGPAVIAVSGGVVSAAVGVAVAPGVVIGPGTGPTTGGRPGTPLTTSGRPDRRQLLRSLRSLTFALASAQANRRYAAGGSATGILSVTRPRERLPA